jgi:quercetin dioxygenase-like cupin family protein
MFFCAAGRMNGARPGEFAAFQDLLRISGGRRHRAPWRTAIQAVVSNSTLSLLARASSPSPRSNAPRTAGEHVEIARAGSQPSTTGAAANFTGRVVITPVFQATDHTRAGGAAVAFEPGARTAWHTRPAGQTLIVVAGTGWVQEWRGVKQEIRQAEVIWTPPGVKHWHGATVTEPMTPLRRAGTRQRQGGRVVGARQRGRVSALTAIR